VLHLNGGGITIQSKIANLFCAFLADHADASAIHEMDTTMTTSELQKPQTEPVLLRIFFWVCAIFLSACALVQVVQSLHWPLFWDAPLMHYPAWLISQGAIPYRDLFDQQFPGLYLLHLCIIKFLGPGDFAWRMADLLSLLLINVCIFSFLKKSGTLPALLAVSLFSCFHLNGLPFHVGQRDFFMLVFFMLGTCFAVSALERSCSLTRLFFSGLFLGAVTMIKPHAAFYLLMIAGVIGGGAVRQGMSMLKPLSVFFISATIVPAGILIWLALNGGLLPLIDIIIHYLVPIYSNMEHPNTEHSDFLFGNSILYIPIVIESAGLAMFTLAVFFVHKRLQLRTVISALGVAYGIFHFVSQGRAWHYHLYPLVLFLILLVAIWLPSYKSGKTNILRIVMIAVMIQLVFGIGIKSVANIFKNQHYDDNVCHELVEDIKPMLKPGDKVQLFSSYWLGVKALYILKVPIASRFMMDMHFFHEREYDYVKDLRAELITTLKKEPPRLIIVSIFPYTIGTGYDRIQLFPEFDSLLNTSYYLAVERDLYRIYEYMSDNKM